MLGSSLLGAVKLTKILILINIIILATGFGFLLSNDSRFSKNVMFGADERKIYLDSW